MVGRELFIDVVMIIVIEVGLGKSNKFYYFILLELIILKMVRLKLGLL